MATGLKGRSRSSPARRRASACDGQRIDGRGRDRGHGRPERAALNDLVAGSGGRAIAQVTDLVDPASCAAMVPDPCQNRPDRHSSCQCRHLYRRRPDGYRRRDHRPHAEPQHQCGHQNVHAVLPHMVGRGSGDIVVTCSLAGRSAIRHEPVYSASKWAITCFTQTTRRQVGTKGVRVAQVSPGPVASALLADWLPTACGRPGRRRHHRAVRRGRCGHVYPDPPRNVTIHDVMVLPTNLDA